MSTSSVSGPVLTQAETQTLKAFQANAAVRLASSKKIVTAAANFDKNQEFFANNRETIANLVKDMTAANAVIQKIVKADGDAGTCKLPRFKRLQTTFTKTVKVVDAAAEINSNLEDKAVVTALQTLGIIAKPKQPRFKLPKISMPKMPKISRPSLRTVAKVGAGVAAVGVVGTGVYFRKEIAEQAPGVFASAKEQLSKAYDFVKENMPSGEQVVAFVKDPTTLKVGGGVVGAVVGAAAIYKAVKVVRAKRAARAAAQVVVAQPVVASATVTAKKA